MIKLRKDRVAYIQIANHLLKQIADEKLLDGDPIGSIRTLAVDYCVTTKTIQKAIDTLEEKDVVERIQAKGIFVNITSQVAKKLLYEEAKQLTLDYFRDLKELSNDIKIDELIHWGKEYDSNK